MGMKKKTFRVDGMHCPRCEDAVRGALSGAEGISDVKADWRKGTVTALWDESVLPEAEVDALLRRAGYGLSKKSGRDDAIASLLKLIFLIAGAVVLYAVLSRTSAARWAQSFPMAREGMGYGMLFLVGFATSLHCIAMCGGINLAQNASSARNGARPLRSNLRYNLGRLTSYTIIGGIIGGIGTVFSFSARAKATIQIIAALFMLVMAANLLGGFSWLRKLTPRVPKGLSDRILKHAAGKSSFLIGLANGLMPCGPLQAMQLYALSAGSWWEGALSMFFFCLGTLPLMLGFGLASGNLMQRYARPMRLASSVLILVMGVSAMANGLALVGVGGPMAGYQRMADGTSVTEDGVQYVYSELDYGSYPEITVRKGIPVEWTIHADRDHITNCNNELYIPAYDITVKLKEGDNIIRFVPDKAGSVPYTCWMGMIRSSILVTEGA